MSSDFLVKAGTASMMPKEVSISVVAVVGTIIRWVGPKTTFWRAFDSKAPHLGFPWCSFSSSDKSGKWTRLFLMSSVTKYLVKNDMLIRKLPMVGNKKKVSSKIFTAKKTRRQTCFRMCSKLPFAI